MPITSVIQIPIAIEARTSDGSTIVEQILETKDSPKVIADGISIRREDKPMFVSKGLPPLTQDALSFTLLIGKDVALAMGAAIVCAYILEKVKDKAKSIGKIRIGDKIVGLSEAEIEKALMEQIQVRRALEGPAGQ